MCSLVPGMDGVAVLIAEELEAKDRREEQMIRKPKITKQLGWLLSAGIVGVAPVCAEETEGIVGKNEWLFNRYEVLRATDAAQTAESIDLIGRFNKVLKANGVSLALTMVPLKMRIYSEYLPDSIKLTDYMASNYDQIGKALRAAGVTVIDLNTPFLSSPKRNSETPLFFRLDSHWNLTGSMLAAETVKSEIDANQVLKGALQSTPEVAYKISFGKRKLPSKGRNLLSVLPRNSGSFTPEHFTPVFVTRAQPMGEDGRASIGVTVAGSSSSQEWTGFLDALRFLLQRDILNVSVNGDIGPWVGMETYLRSDAYQSNVPKLLIWEWAESTVHAPPDYKYQAAHLISNNTEWLLRVSAWAQSTCKPAAVNAKLARVGLGVNAATAKGQQVVTGVTNVNDYIELVFDKPMEKLDYLVASAVTLGSKNLILEGIGSGTSSRRFTVGMPGDGVAHMVKTPLPSGDKGVSRVRIYPGNSDSFVFKDWKICRQPEDLLN